jgi:hypothetical protein
MDDRPPRRDHSDPFSYIDLRRARLCLDCEAIFEGPQCPACTSESFVPVTRWIRPMDAPAREERSPARAVQPGATAAPRPKRLLKKSLYVGLGAYGMWKMLFEPAKSPKPRPRKPPSDTA